MPTLELIAEIQFLKTQLAQCQERLAEADKQGCEGSKIMLTTCSTYVEDDDKIDWEPAETQVIIWFGTQKWPRYSKLSLSFKKAKELKNLLERLTNK